MSLAIAIFVAGISLIATILGMRWLDGHQWSHSLIALRLQLPATLTADDVARWLDVIAAITHTPKWSLLPYPPIGLEIVADNQYISHYVLAPKALEPKLMSILRAGLPGVRVEAAPDYLRGKPIFQLAAELKATSTIRPFGDSRTETASAALLASLQPLNSGEEIHYQEVYSKAS